MDGHHECIMKALNFTLPIILLGCAIALFVFGVRSFVKVISDEGTRLQTPGVTTVEVPEAGNYDLWTHTKMLERGTIRTFPDEIPEGTKIVITSKRDGSSVSWRVHEGMGQSSESSSSTSFGTATFKEAGSYEVAVALPDEERSFSIAAAKFPQPFLSALLGLLGGIFLGLGAALWLGVVVILLFVKRGTAKQTTSAVSPQR